MTLQALCVALGNFLYGPTAPWQSWSYPKLLYAWSSLYQSLTYADDAAIIRDTANDTRSTVVMLENFESHYPEMQDIPKIARDDIASRASEFKKINCHCETNAQNTIWARGFFVLLLMIPTLLGILANFAVARVLGHNRGYEARYWGTALQTMVLATSTAISVICFNYLAWEHSRTRILSGVPALAMFALTYIPPLEWRRQDLPYQVGIVIVQVVTFLILGFGPEFLFEIRIARIKRAIKKNPVDQSRMAQLLSDWARARDEKKRFSEGRGKRYRSFAMVFYDTYRVRQLTRTERVLRVLCGKPAPPNPWLVKLLLEIPLLAVSGFNIYAFREDLLALLNLIGWTLGTALILFIFALLPHIDLEAMLKFFSNMVAGTFINTIIISRAVYVDGIEALDDGIYFIKLTCINALATVAFVDHIGRLCLPILKLLFFWVKQRSDENIEVPIELQGQGETAIRT